MTAENTPGSGAKALVAGGTALALVVAVLGWWLTRDAEVPPPAPRTDASTGAKTTPPAPVAPQSAAEATDAQPKPPQQQATPAPRFDVIRVEPDGSAVIAGQAAPGSVVQLMLDEDAVAQVETDASGNFVALLTLPPSDTSRVMRLMVDGQTVQASDQDVIIGPVIAPVKAPEVVVADAAPKKAPEDIPGEKNSESAQNGAGSPTANTTTAQSAEPITAPATPQVLLADRDGIKVVQDASPDAKTLSLDSISYDENGAVMVAGRGASGTRLRILLDTDPLVETEVGTDGQWRVELPDIAPGVYSLRIEARAQSGALLAQVDTPFKREDPAQIAALTTAETGAAGAATPRVEAGDTAIAGASETVAPGTTAEIAPKDAMGPIADAAQTVSETGIGTGAETGVKSGAAQGEIAKSEAPETVAQTAQAENQETPPRVALATQDTTAPSQDMSHEGTAPENTGSAETATVDSAQDMGATSGRPPSQPALTENAAALAGTGDAATNESSGATMQAATVKKDQATTAQPPRPRIVTVQPGATLWAIARDNLGKGVMYVQVFDANRDKIRNPDLIYPGQVFTVPGRTDSAQN